MKAPQNSSTTLLPSTASKSSKKRRQHSTREIAPIYWRKLIEVDVPINTAMVIAWAIARYDSAKKIPDPQQQDLIKYYCRQICRAELWRSNLLKVAI